MVHLVLREEMEVHKLCVFIFQYIIPSVQTEALEIFVLG
jgi:hypothetical protein